MNQEMTKNQEEACEIVECLEESTIKNTEPSEIAYQASRRLSEKSFCNIEITVNLTNVFREYVTILPI